MQTSSLHVQQNKVKTQNEASKTGTLKSQAEYGKAQNEAPKTGTLKSQAEHGKSPKRGAENKVKGRGQSTFSCSPLLCLARASRGFKRFHLLESITLA